MSGVDIDKAKKMIDELRLLERAAKVRTFSGKGLRVLADNCELTTLTPAQVVPWMIRGTHQLSKTGRQQLHETIRALELEIN